VASPLKLSDWFWQTNDSLLNELQREDVDHPIIRRVLAFAIDYISLGAVIGGGAIAMALLGDEHWTIHNLAAIVLTLVYFTLGASTHWRGMTMGKRIFKIKAVHENGKPIGIGRAFLRSVPIAILTNAFNIVRMVRSSYENETLTTFTSAMIILILVGVLYFALVKLNRQGLHDLLASTHVVEMDAVLETKKQLSVGVVVGYFVLAIVVLAATLVF
jgi:uncharacterized RDD family membrane protein YckC